MSLDHELLSTLTRRELQVAARLAVGATNRELAAELRVSIKTIDTHRNHVMNKLALRNNAALALALFAVRTGLASMFDDAEPVAPSEISPAPDASHPQASPSASAGRPLDPSASAGAP